MSSKLERAWRSLSREQAIVIVAIVVVSGWLASKTDAATWEKLAEADPTDLGLRVGLFLLALYGVFTRGRPAELPGARKSRTGGSDVGTALLVGLGLLGASSAVPGCSLSTAQRHAAAIHVAATSSAIAGEVISAAVTAEAERTCPDSEDDSADVACVSTLRERWAPADVAMLSVRVALVAWVEAVAVGEGGAPWDYAYAAVRRLVREWSNLVRVVQPYGVSLGGLPPIVEELVGGEP